MVAVYWESWRAKNPLLLFGVFKVKYMRPLFVVLVLCWGSMDIFMLCAAWIVPPLLVCPHASQRQLQGLAISGHGCHGHRDGSNLHSEQCLCKSTRHGVDELPFFFFFC